MFSLLIIILAKNHNLSLALDNQTVKLLSFWLINWISSVYSCEHVEYSNISFYSTIMSTLIISQCQLNLSFQAHQLFSSISLLSCAQFSWLNFLWLEFSCFFLIIFLFDWSHSCVWNFDQIYYCKQLFCFVSYFSWEVFCLFLFFIMFCLLVWNFSQAFYYESLFDLMQHFQKRFLFAFLNFRSTNFFNVCIQCVKMSLTNLIDKDLISSANQIQSEADNQL